MRLDSLGVRGGAAGAGAAESGFYLIYVLREYRAGTTLAVRTERLPFGLWQYYARCTSRWRDEHADGWDGTHLPLLATLAVAREPLSFTTLCALWLGSRRRDGRWR